jgi:hypothetical protein
MIYVRLATSVDEKSLVPFGMLGFIKTIFSYVILAKIINLDSVANIRKILGSTILSHLFYFFFEVKKYSHLIQNLTII